MYAGDEYYSDDETSDYLYAGWQAEYDEIEENENV